MKETELKEAGSSRICLENVSRSFGAVTVLTNLSLCIEAGEFVAIVGPSGCGKTTLLNLMSGFDSPTEGRITRPERIRCVYQQSGLLPWKTVRDNIALGLRGVQQTRPEQSDQIVELLRLIGLENFADFYPHQISGGMRQRVELARAMAGESDALLLDEPFSALDYLTRLKMRNELARLIAASRARADTIVLVTHDIEEAVQLADRVLILTERPARVGSEMNLGSLPPRPRPLNHPLVVAAVHDILQRLGIGDTANPSV